MLGELISWIVQTVSDLGYIGIFVMMLLESSFFPFPSEVAMIPAGYLASKGEMNIYLVVMAGILGSLAGAVFNYWLALKFGRVFVLKFGKYFFFKEETLIKMETYLIETVQNRVKEMMQDERVVEIYNSFENEQDGQEYIIKAAIATLVGVNK